jgi:hypothetical protein
VAGFNPNLNRLQTNKKEEKSSMKKVFLTLSLVLAAGSAFGQGNTLVRWQKIVGVITAPGVDNPVAVTTDANGNVTNSIHSGGLPWATRGGSVRVNLSTGEGSFDVEGLVLVGGNATGTTGPVTSVVGTLVCNPGTADQVILDTAAANLSSTGNAELSFKLNIPSTCNSPLFLIRAGVRWIATGAMRVTGNAFLY